MFDINQKITIKEAKLMNPIVLAYIGDGVHTLYIREKLTFSSDKKSNLLNKEEATIACATSQAKAAEILIPIFTEEESAIFHRARNSKKGSKAKNSTAANYMKATGFEAVIGYLFITGQIDRLNQLLGFVDENDGQNIKILKKDKEIVSEKDNDNGKNDNNFVGNISK